MSCRPRNEYSILQQVDPERCWAGKLPRFSRAHIVQGFLLGSFAGVLRFSRRVLFDVFRKSVTSLWMFLVHHDNLLDFVITAHEYSWSVVNMFGNDGQHSLHAAVDCLSTSYSTENQYGIATLNKLFECIPFSKTMAIGAHSYNILNFPFGLFLSAGYANMPP